MGVQAQSTTPCFIKTDVGVGNNPYSVVVVDVSGDNLPDIITANYGSNTVSVMLGQSGGTFGTKTDYATGTRPRSVAVADVNNDNSPDIITANKNSDNVSVLLGQGGGTFGAKTDYVTGDDPESVAVTDVNNDKRPDIITANYNGNSVSVLFGQSGGTFGAKTDFAVGDNPESVVVADVNSDNIPDIITANSISYTVSVLLGQGAGSFGQRTDYTAGYLPVSVAVADINNDNRPDIITANYLGASVSVLLGQSGGTFGTKTDYTVGYNPLSVTVADVNNDKLPDIVAANYAEYSNTVSVLLGQNGGTFGPATNLPAGDGPSSVVVADVSGDNLPDIIATNYRSGTVSVLTQLAAPANLSLSVDGTLSCNKSSVRLTAQGWPADASYQFDGPGLSNINRNSASAGVSGLYSVTASVGACSANASVQVEGNTSFLSLSLAAGGVISCASPTVKLTAQGGPAGASYQFAGPALSSTNSNSANAGLSGLYSVTAITGVCSATAGVQVEGNTNFSSLSLVVSGVITCTNPTVRITAQGGPEGASYQFSGPSLSSINGRLASAGVSGPYSVTASVGVCSATASTTVGENKTPPQEVQLTTSGPLTCSRTSTTLYPSSTTTGATFILSGPTLSGSNATGPGQFTVTATNPTNGCTATATTAVSQNIAPPTGLQLTSSGTLSANNPTVTLTASSNTTASVGVSYSFSPPTQQSAPNQASVSQSGTYSVTATRADNGCPATASTTVLGAASPTACRNTSASITLTPAGNPSRYEWYIGVAVGQPLRDGAYYQGTGTASLRVVSVSQSQIYYAKVFYADGSSVVYGPYRVTLNTNCGARTAAGVNSPGVDSPGVASLNLEPGTELRITLLGNPLQGEALRALVAGAAGQRLQVELVDLSGRSVRSQVIEAADSQQLLEWSLTGWASGSYLLQAVSGQQRQSVKVLKP